MTDLARMSGKELLAKYTLALAHPMPGDDAVLREIIARLARLEALERALQSLPNENSKKLHWCSRCEKWVGMYSSSGYETCTEPGCNQDLSDSATIDQFMRVIKQALSPPAEREGG